MLCLVFWDNSSKREKDFGKEGPSGKYFSNLEQAKRCDVNRKRRWIKLEITGISLAFVLNSSQMREVSYEKEGFYFATKEYIAVTSYDSCKCHFASFCNFWMQDIKTKILLTQSSSVYFLYLMGNSLSIRLLHVTYGPSQAGLKTFTAHSWRHFTPCGALLVSGSECYLMGRGCAAALGWEAVTGCRQKVWITRINQAVPEGFIMIWCTVLGLQQLIPPFLKKMRSPVLCRERNSICMRKLNGPRTVICPWGHLAWHGSQSHPSKTKREVVLSLCQLNCTQELSWMVFDAKTVPESKFRQF